MSPGDKVNFSFSLACVQCFAFYIHISMCVCVFERKKETKNKKKIKFYNPHVFFFLVVFLSFGCWVVWVVFLV